MERQLPRDHDRILIDLDWDVWVPDGDRWQMIDNVGGQLCADRRTRTEIEELYGATVEYRITSNDRKDGR